MADACSHAEQVAEQVSSRAEQEDTGQVRLPPDGGDNDSKGNPMSCLPLRLGKGVREQDGKA
eukprot:749486-Hanusia_phi.AAC.2